MANTASELVTLTRDSASGVFTLHLHSSSQAGLGVCENRFEPNLVFAVNAALDIVETAPGPCALVVTAVGKFFSNGHDVEWLSARAKERDGSAEQFLRSFYILLARFMTLPVPTVAAVNGHAFAGGCLLAMAQDYRVMRADRGYICMNEVDMGLTRKATMSPPPLTLEPGQFEGFDQKMVAVLASKLPRPLLREVLLCGRRYGGSAALECGIVHEAAAGDVATLEAATVLAAKYAQKAPPHNRKTFGLLKYELVRETVEILTDGGRHRRRGAAL